jgi:hypothetical protein
MARDRVAHHAEPDERDIQSCHRPDPSLRRRFRGEPEAESRRSEPEIPF